MGTQTGALFNPFPKTYNGTKLSALVFKDQLQMQYYYQLLDLNIHCDGCAAKVNVQHTLACKVRGLVTMRQNKVKKELASLCTKAFNPSIASDKQLIILFAKFWYTKPNKTVIETPAKKK